MKVVIAGGGSVGRFTAEQLVAAGHEVTIIENDRAVVRAMVQLARDLGLAVSADGVETGSQADALLALGCTTHQGHLYARPMTASALEDLLLRHVAEFAGDVSMP